MAKDPYRYFRVEARELVEGMGRGVLQLEQGTTPDVAANLLRLAHTLKGAARVVRQTRIAEQAHAIEDALAPLRDGAAPLASEGIDQVLKLLDEIAGGISALDQAPAAVDAPARPAAPPEVTGARVTAGAAAAL